jgi:hypothetical protein
VVAASWRAACFSEWNVNAAAGSYQQELFCEEESFSDLIVNLREAYHDPLQPAVLMAGCH